MAGALVLFGNGASVKKVSLLSDFSAVHISGLPRNTSADSVIDLVSNLGLSVPVDSVRVQRAIDGSGSADVRKEDETFAAKLCDAIKKHDTYSTYDCVAIQPTIPQLSTHRRVDAKTVHCSWHKPSTSAWLNFGSENVAAIVSKKFVSGKYTICGQKVSSETPTRGAGHFNHQAWTVKLTGLPSGTDIGDITQAIPTGLQPRHIEKKSTYEVDLPLAEATIKSLLCQSGPLEWWQSDVDNSDGKAKRYKAKARFVHDADAHKAAQKYNNSQLSFSVASRLSVQLIHAARMKVFVAVYDAAASTIDQHIAKWAASHVRFTAYPQDHRGFRVLKLEGSVRSAVAEAKSALESILRGEVLKTDDGEPVWATSFVRNGHAWHEIKGFQHRFGVVLVRDKQRQQIRVLGKEIDQKRVRTALLALAEEEIKRGKQDAVIALELDVTQLAWACRGGYRDLCTTLGDGHVTLDIASRPQRILISGSATDVQTARDMLVSLSLPGQDQQKTGKLPETNDCSICWTEAEDPVTTACGHVYCGGCFEDMCLAGASPSDTQLSIRCQGNAGECQLPISLEALHEHLSSTSLEDVLDSAFKVYQAKHTDELKPCPTPDCPQIYRVVGKSDNTVLTCPACLAAVCRRCHAVHEGLSCADYRDRATGGYQALQIAKAKLGIKDCPKCGTMIEKTYGCNHMTCGGCSAHICWVCMRVFAAEEVYAHMNRAHGGIGLPAWD